MTFNLRDFLRQTAAKKTDLNKTTEGQLANNGKAPSQLGEAQLDKSRGNEPTAIVEKQLDAVRGKKASADSVTEAQLEPHKGPVPAALSEKQLDDGRTDHSEAPVEKRLDAVRQSTFNLKEHMAKRAAKKDTPDSVTEGQLGKRKDTEPKELSEAQLDADRKDGKIETTEARLEKVRTGEAQKLTEAQMDDSKSKLVKHRNPDASKGDINKVEEQRLAGKKAAEKEEYEAASKTDKEKMLPQPNSPDGLKVAGAKAEVSKTAQRKPRVMDKDFGGDFPIDELSPEAERMLREFPDVEKEISPSELDIAAKDAELAGANEISEPVAVADAGVDEEDEGEAKIPQKFAEIDVKDIDAGMAKMRQIVLSFDPMGFENKDEVKSEATTWMFAHHPSLFTYRPKGKRDMISVRDNITVSMEEGRVVALLPAEAFQRPAAA